MKSAKLLVENIKDYIKRVNMAGKQNNQASQTEQEKANGNVTLPQIQIQPKQTVLTGQVESNGTSF